MKLKLLTLNHSLLFLCTSIYLGTGWSLVLFSFPVAPSLTTDNYYMQFVPQVTAATKFLTWLTLLMIALAIVMLIAEWRSGFRWVPIVVLLGVLAATGLTMKFLLPLNQEMAARITDPGRLGEVLSKWMSLNRVRVGMWTVQWLAMMVYFAVKTCQREELIRAR
jgi:MFS superfamily sulfate permease-like transporter